MHQYDPKQVKIMFDGALLDGFADGSFCKIVYNKPLFTLKVGADGASTRSKSNDLSAKITITLMPGSTGNLKLSAAYLADVAAGIGQGIPRPFEVVDPSTGTSFSALSTWITTDPGIDLATEANPIAWELEAEVMLPEHGAAV